MNIPLKPSTKKALLEKAYSFLQVRDYRIGETVFGPSPPNIFVGRMGYPRVNVGPLVSVVAEPWEVNAEFIDSPDKWSGMDYAQIISMRSSLLRGKKRHGVRSESRMLSDLQETVLSRKSVDLEVKFRNPPRFSMDFSSIVQPMGPSGVVEKLEVVGNTAIPKKIDELIEERLKVREALPEILSSGLDIYYFQKVLSAGVLGGEKRKLVPTRWSITAGDKLIADYFLEQVREFDCVSDYQIYSNEFLYNHFEVLLLPGKWEFEQFEAWAPGTVWTRGENQPTVLAEYEPFEGRSDYAELEGGGYYAGRFGVVEGLHAMRRQARCVVFREIHEEYQVPVGVWQVRQSVRQAMQQPPTKTSSLKEAMELLSKRLRTPIATYFSKSRILGQKKMLDY